MSQSAASRVFAIYELLEKVLLNIEPNDLDKAHNSNKNFNPDIPVVSQLFSLQRVNSTFASTIHNSKNLRKRMLLEPSTTHNGTQYANAFRALHWFTSPGSLCSKLTHGTIKPLYLGDARGGGVNVSAHKPRPTSIDADTEASWREIPILDFDPAKPTILDFNVTFRLRGDNTYKEMRKLEYQLCPTLGDFHDFCVKMLSREEAVHLLALAPGRYGMQYESPELLAWEHA